MKKLSRGDFPWQTDNKAIAFCFYLAGIPFHNDDAPLVNQYDAMMLKKMGYGPQSSDETKPDVEIQAGRAYNDGREGHIEYGFELTLDLGDVLESYKAAKTTAAGSTVSARVLVSAIMERRAAGQLSKAEAISAAACTIINRWKAELKEWQGSDYKLAVAKIATGNFDARSYCEAAFMSGNFNRFAAWMMDARRAFLEMWKNYPATIRWMRAGKSHATGEGERQIIHSPGWV